MLSTMLYLNLFLGSSSEDIDLDLQVDRKNWIDPNDPFSPTSFCTKYTIDELAICQANLEECLKVSGHSENNYIHDPTLKHIIRNLLFRMNVDIDKTTQVDRIVEIFLSTANMAILKKYLDSKDETVTEREQVREILEGLIVPQHYEDVSYMKRFFGIIVDFLPLLNVLLLAPAVLILYRSYFSIRSFMGLLFFVSFVISVFNTFHKKYQTIIAIRMSHVEKSLAEKCKSDSFMLSAMNVVWEILFFKKENECEQHYKDLYVDPIYEISPLDVICEVLSNFMFTPLGIFGRHFNTFFYEFFRDSPLHITALKMITFFFLVVVIIFWIGDYRIRTFMATIEPSGTTQMTSPMVQLPNCHCKGERSEIKNSKLRLMLSPERANIRPTNSTIAGNTRRRSLSISRLSMLQCQN